MVINFIIILFFVNSGKLVVESSNNITRFPTLFIAVSITVLSGFDI
jgi:hypothetical protein